MPRESLIPAIVDSFARRYTIEQLDEAIGQLGEAFLTSSFHNLSVLGMNVGQNSDKADTILQTLEAARQIKLEAEDATGETTASALDAKAPLGIGFDFSQRQIT